MIRLFDVLFALLGIMILLPLMFVIYLLVIAESKGGGLYIQKRVGKDGIDFNLMKFRSMLTGFDKTESITMGAKGPGITKSGYFIRRFKLDELPQLFNVLKGDMSFVGPRPELRRYVNLYTIEQRKVLNIRPGITDYASIEYANENTMLGLTSDPESVYINEIMPNKLSLNMKYIMDRSIKEYFHIIIITFFEVIKRKK